jgi:GNAT superfamily N-acetyltransferase
VTERRPRVDAPRDAIELTLAPLTPERWNDFEAIFHAKGCSIARGCWCMAYRVSGSPPPPPPGITFAERNRRALKSRVDAGEFIGLIGYRAKAPVGWISFGPREAYRRLEKSPVMKAVDDKPVWSVICFVVPGEWRGQGIARALLDGAIAYAKRKRAGMLEAYPVDSAGPARDDSLWFGTRSMFAAAGFVEVARRKPARPVMRLAV